MFGTFIFIVRAIKLYFRFFFSSHWMIKKAAAEKKTSHIERDWLFNTKCSKSIKTTKFCSVKLYFFFRWENWDRMATATLTTVWSSYKVSKTAIKMSTAHKTWWTMALREVGNDICVNLKSKYGECRERVSLICVQSKNFNIYKMS